MPPPLVRMLGALMLALLSWGSAADADAPTAVAAATEEDASHILHLLNYVSADYAGAVGEAGELKDARELAEQIEVLREAGRIGKGLGGAALSGGARAGGSEPAAGGAAAAFGAPPADMGSGIAQIIELAERHATPAQVTGAIAPLQAALTARYSLQSAELGAPSRDRGSALFEKHCSTCHGPTGHADTARAATYTPRPANFHDARVSGSLSPERVVATVRFGVPNTAMVPFDFLSDQERYDVAFFVSTLDHVAPNDRSERGRMFTLRELASKTDDELRRDLASSGVADSAREVSLDDLRTRAPYDPRGSMLPLLRARWEVRHAARLFEGHDAEQARRTLVRVYLERIEPLEAPLRSTDGELAGRIEKGFQDLRAALSEGNPSRFAEIATLLMDDLERAERILEGQRADSASRASFLSAILTSAGIALREGVEAALLLGALLSMLTRAGLSSHKRMIHVGWLLALVAGGGTWFFSSKVIELSGIGREMLEGVTALLAAAVLFYVSYWLIAKSEVARWMSFLRSRASRGGPGLPLLGVAFLAAYREAFETVIFYQALLATTTSRWAVGLGIGVGLLLLAVVVIVYGRAGKFAPPRAFFTFSGVLLYSLSVIFSGQGIAALQTTGHLPLHPLPLPRCPALGLYPTWETYSVQLLLVLAALLGALRLRGKSRVQGATAR